MPGALGASPVEAAEACQSGIATYVHDRTPGTAPVLRKYLDWDPLTGNAAGSLIDSGETAELDEHSQFFTGGKGIIYVITAAGGLKTYKDNTATGGSLLTPVHDYGGDWNGYEQVWSGGGNRLFALSVGGALDVYSVDDPTSGTGAIKKIKTVLGTDSAVAEIGRADDVWSVGATVYTLKRGIADRPGTVKAWPYAETATGSPFSAGSTTVITGIGTKETRGWSPGPGTVYTVGDTPDYTGIARSYTGSAPMSLANAEVGAGFYGDVHADLASCLASPSEDVKPAVGPESPETETPPEAVNDESPDPAPQDPTEFSGKFILGDGRPAAGLPVKLEAVDVLVDTLGEEQIPALGETVTADDGSWHIKLPQTLPESVKATATANGGAVNAKATVFGKTESDVPLIGTRHVSAVPAGAPAAARALVTNAVEVMDAPEKLLPLTDDMKEEQPEPTEAQYALSWASRNESTSVDTLGDKPLPEYQSDTGGLPTDDPYVVKGTDIKSMAVGPMDGGCDRVGSKIYAKKIYYTVVGEGHAYWDTKATVDYDSKLSSTVETAAKIGGKWQIDGSVTLGSSMSATTGYTNRGPYFAKQWKVPLEYKKRKTTYKCNYGRDTYYTYEMMAGRYKVPSGGAVGKYGKNVSSKDGAYGYRRSPKRHRAYVQPQSYFQINKNRSTKWSSSVSAFGVKLGASTQYDKEHKQRITAGKRKTSRHDIWGKNDKVSGKPGVFYSY
ncbi:hypothetical protein [Streptomyces sp. NRRL S-920]|uniref:hypothetical protein n=1 Tax=Streptomyces sp. NRRL S-920 TaxID=1463921 RepID=UPI0004C64DA6|nr:hypothetical protein [Streptomyces sp. NRRL S-920]